MPWTLLQPSPTERALAAVDPDPAKCLDFATDDVFQERVLEYQQTKLRAAYEDAMKDLWPGWKEEYCKPENRIRCDFRSAVDSCDSEMSWRMIEKWLDLMDKQGDGDSYTPLIENALWPELRGN